MSTVFCNSFVLRRKVSVLMADGIFSVVHANIDECRTAKRFLSFEPEFLEQFKGSVANSRVVYDIGGYIGLYSLAAVCCNPQAAVYCFEPQLVNYHSITRNAAANDYCSIHVYQTALGDMEVEVPFARSGQTGRIATSEASGDTENTPLTTLDRLVQQEKIPPPDTMKIDVEGYEAHVLRGMQSILQQNKPVVLVEIHPNFLREFGERADGVDDFMAGFGYEKQILSQPNDGKTGSHPQIHVAYLPEKGN